MWKAERHFWHISSVCRLARESSSRSAEGEQIIDETLNRKAGLVHLAEIGGEALEAIARGRISAWPTIALTGALADMRQRELQEIFGALLWRSDHVPFCIRR
jgi:hypothetical protein